MHSPYNQENPTRKFVEWDTMVPKWCFLESLNKIVITKWLIYSYSISTTIISGIAVRLQTDVVYDTDE